MISNGYVATVAVAPATAPNTKLLFKKFEEEFIKFAGKSAENMIEEFKKFLSNYIVETFEISVNFDWNMDKVFDLFILGK